MKFDVLWVMFLVNPERVLLYLLHARINEIASPNIIWSRTNKGTAGRGKTG